MMIGNNITNVSLDFKSKKYNMKLQQTIRRILREEFDKKITCKCGWSWKFSEGGDEPYLCHKCGNDNSKKESKRIKILKNEFDEVFDKFTLKKEPDLISFEWYYNGEIMCGRNNYGYFFISDNRFFRPLKSIAKDLLSLTYEEYKQMFIDYLNTRYKKEFEDRPILNISSPFSDNWEE